MSQPSPAASPHATPAPTSAPINAAPEPSGSESPPSALPGPAWQAACGSLVLIVAALMAWGAIHVDGDAGYGGVGPNFLPWLCAAALAVCGALLVWEAVTGGFRHAGDPGGRAQARWMCFVWVASGLLANALLIEKIGFVLSCALCYFLAVQGLRRAAHENINARILIIDLAWGFIISAPTYWMFSRLLDINLPHILNTGWL